MNWLRASLIAQIGLGVYFQAFLWLPLGSWNDQEGFQPLAVQIRLGTVTRGDLLLAFAFALPPLVFLLAYLRSIRWLMWGGVAGYAGWLYLQLKGWWVPYIFGASERWMNTQRTVFARTTKILPSFGNHPAPDAMHFVLQLLLLTVLLSAVKGLLGPAATPRAARPAPGTGG